MTGQNLQDKSDDHKLHSETEPDRVNLGLRDEIDIERFDDDGNA